MAAIDVFGSFRGHVSEAYIAVKDGNSSSSLGQFSAYLIEGA
jgi:hypothetical protein